MHRISAKLFLNDPSALDLADLIDVFHGWIREKKLDGLPIDVADYRHVPSGPGVVLVGHEFECALDGQDDRVGLTYTHKRLDGGDLPAGIRRTLAGALTCCRLLQADLGPGITFAADRMALAFLDRLRAPNDGPTFEKLRGDLAGALASLYGSASVSLERQTVDDRRPLTVLVTAETSESLESLAERLTA